ncbi:E3 ubiquitin-protein ligase UBR5, partial [Lingula anatina]|uniref:E3 ubiquitin-protein ligase UBR5 n=1 Tax=Lingula anatina TaxID=7574 RepID=A0A1S3K5S8_LINAN
MSSIHFVVHPLPGTEEQLNERLKEVAERISHHGYNSPPALSTLWNSRVTQVAVGPSHVAFLLEDGRVCRLPFSILSERLDLSKSDQKARWGAMNNTPSSSRGTTGQAAGSSLTRAPPRPHGRVVRAAGRGRGGVIVGSRPLVPASVVPEDLINQCQVVLQGKSRNLIIRELQRTNLDVNLAVNNLLSRDDEGDENDEDSQDSYMQDDLISLLDAGIHADHPGYIIDADAMFNEDMFGYSSLRSRPNRGRGTTTDRDSTLERERESMFRLRDRRWLDSALRDENALRSLDRDRTEGLLGNEPLNKKKTNPSQNPMCFGEELQFWSVRDGPTPKFIQIASMHSELVALSSTGQLFQWRWMDMEPFYCAESPYLHHPKTSQLGLVSEKIIGLATCSVRASLFTESGKVATFVDDSLGIVAAKLEHAAQSFAEFTSDKIVSLHACSLYTCARLESGALYWWGVMPFGQRKKLIEKARAKTKKSKHSASTASDIQCGSQVCLRSCPMYHTGALAFTTVGGVPKVGQLMESAWTLNDSCRFKIKTIVSEPRVELRQESKSMSCESKPDMPPPPSPASSTCSDQSGPTLRSPGTLKRKKQQTPVKELIENKNDEEEWALKDVSFVEDVKTVPMGRVLKVDGVYVAVKFNNKEGEAKEDSAVLLQDCRLMRKDELMVIKGSNAPRIPDCFQKVPKKVMVPDSGQILAITVDCHGIHMVARTGNKMKYMVYNLSTGKIDQDRLFPTHTTAFTGKSERNIALINAGEDTPVVLQDGNGALYPLVKNCAEGIRDPLWLDLPPMSGLGMGVQGLHNVGLNAKNRAVVIVVALENQLLIPAILRCDSDRVKAVLTSAEQETNGSTKQKLIQDLLGERCDGNKNILHTTVAACAPTSNKEENDPNSVTTATPSALSSAIEAINAVSSAVDALTSIHNRGSGSETADRLAARSVSLREMMRRATSAARAFSNMDPREQSGEREEPPPGLPIPTLSWPPDPQEFTPLRAEPEKPHSRPPSNPPTPGPGPSGSSGGGVGGTPLPETPLDPMSVPPVRLEEKERKTNSQQILKLICDSPVLQPYLFDLLSAKNAEGCTPFMQAVCCRAYTAALVIMDACKKVSTKDGRLDKDMLMLTIYPPGSSLDNSPLHVLCCNDTCSFTWTGAEHINQDIFECKTCGLLGTLCCCTECAQVCHKGHDCKLKRTSPTAYCNN